jgi:hypothetical protein
MAAETPEELETLLEDAVVLGDVAALLGLFSPHGVLAGPVEHAQGPVHIARSARAMLSDGWEYVADPTLVLQAHRTALVINTHALNVARRGRDGLWRYEICRLNKAAGLS